MFLARERSGILKCGKIHFTVCVKNYIILRLIVTGLKFCRRLYPKIIFDFGAFRRINPFFRYLRSLP